MRLGPFFFAPVGWFQTVLGFEGCSDQQPARVLLDSGSVLDESVMKALKINLYQKCEKI